MPYIRSTTFAFNMLLVYCWIVGESVIILIMFVHKVILLISLIGFMASSPPKKKSSHKGKLVFIDKTGEKEVATKTCKSGVYFKPPRVFDCVCITGVFAFYEKFCDVPTQVLGGKNYCFRADNLTISQVALSGSSQYPLIPSITHFKGYFLRITTTVVEEYESVNLDAAATWITITNTEWTIYSDSGESMCLTPTRRTKKRKMYCVFGEQFIAQIFNASNWINVVKVRRGCYSSQIVKADICYDIKSNKNKSACSEYPDTALTPSCDYEDSDEGTNPECGWINITSILGKTPETENEVYIPLYPPLKQNKPFTTARTIQTLADSFSGEVWLPKPKLTTLTTTPIPTTTTTLAPVEVKCQDIDRDKVKEYWVDPISSECSKSLNEAMFTDQLRRFAVTRLDKIFDSRLHSLQQMEQLLSHSRDIMKKTCGSTYVPWEFFDVAAEAFTMFVREDFFYGMEGVDGVTFDRMVKSLKKCLKRAKMYVFETKPSSCDIKKITGTLILPEGKINVTIPENGKSKHFEPLIESTWKMLLNAHSYCFEDFQFVNDHHYFSVLFLEMFSKTIYEKWIEPLGRKELYKFIVPKYEVMKEIMENIDYCVAATNHVSKCPVWLTRSNPLAKPVIDMKSSTRIKRSVWTDRIISERDRAKIPNFDSAYCTQHMGDPWGLLDLEKCDMIV